MIEIAGDINSHRIKPIETKYKGYRFRSRLEARWAVFFDSLGISWEYEKEGYDLGDLGKYLPDFWIPIIWHEKYSNPGLFIEIKGLHPDESAFDKLKILSVRSKHSGRMFIGLPGEQKSFWCHNSGNCGWYEGIKHPIKLNEFLVTDSIFALQCLCVQTTAKKIPISKAINAMKSARFEHGEEP